jgi:hypothetical protein
MPYCRQESAWRRRPQTRQCLSSFLRRHGGWKPSYRRTGASGYHRNLAVSQRMLYYQVKYRDASNRTVATGQIETIAVP